MSRYLWMLCMVVSVSCSKKVPEIKRDAQAVRVVFKGDELPYVFRADPKLYRTYTRVPKHPIVAPPKDDLDGCQGAYKWRCKGVSAPLKADESTFNTSLFVTAWWIDGSNKSGCAADTNTGTSLTCGGRGVGPLATAQELVNNRWGSSTPTLNQAVTINIMSDMQWETDSFGSLVPTLNNNGEVDITGTMGQVYFSNTISAYAPINRVTATKAQISVVGVDWSTSCGGATCVGADVHDITGNLQFTIEADLGSGVANITTPFELPWRFFAPEGTPAPGDAITVGRPVYVSGINFDAIGGSGATGNQMVLTEMTFANIIEGTQLTINDKGFELYASQNTVVPPMFIEGTNGGYPSPGGGLFWSCAIGNAVTGAAWTGTGRFFGGLFAGSGTFFESSSVLDGDVLIDGSTHQNGQIHLGNVYWVDPLGPDVDVGFTRWELITVLYGAPHVWGPGGWTAAIGYEIDFAPLLTATSSVFLQNGLAITGQVDGYGWTWENGSGIYNPTPMPVTVGNIDALPRGGCLTNPPGGGRWCLE